MREFHGSEVVVNVKKVHTLKRGNIRKFFLILGLLIALNFSITHSDIIPTEYTCHEDDKLIEDEDEIKRCITEPEYDELTGEMVVERYTATPYSNSMFLSLGMFLLVLLILFRPTIIKLGEIQYHKTVLTNKWEYDQYTRKEGKWKQ